MSNPDYFRSNETIVVITDPDVRPVVSGDLSICTPAQKALRPLMNPQVKGAFASRSLWFDITYTDPHTGKKVQVVRQGQDTITIREVEEDGSGAFYPVSDPVELKNIEPSPDVVIDTAKYITCCQFVLFHGIVDDLAQSITVVSGINGQRVQAMLGQHFAFSIAAHRSEHGLLQYRFPGGIGTLALPSSLTKRMMAPDDPDQPKDPRDPPPAFLDHHRVTPTPHVEPDLSLWPDPPLTWNLIE